MDNKEMKPIKQAALKALRTKHKGKKLTIIGVEEDVVASTGQPLYRFYAVPQAYPNQAAHVVVVDHEGHEIDVEELNKREGKRHFAALEPVLDVGHVHAPTPVAAAITINPPENILTLNPGDSQTETITVKVPKSGAAPTVDVYFLADTTGSMTSILNAVKTGASNILSSLAALGIDFSYGVGNYKDFPRDSFAFQHQQSMTNVAAAVTTAINAWTASGGSDGPEGQFFALHKLAEPAGGGIGWRASAKRIIVWFGDYPAHDPICSAISGEPAHITEASVTSKLTAEGITVLAISVLAPGLDADPVSGAVDYAALCGAPGGTAGQATRIANATGGQFVSGVNAGNIVTMIISLVTTAAGTINNLRLVAAGGTAPFVVSITPAGGYGPLAGDQEHDLQFEVAFRGTVSCKDEPQVFGGSLDVIADAKVVARKKVQINVPACPRMFRYVVKFICGEQRECGCECVTVRPGIYATDINIHNYNRAEVAIEKMVIPLFFLGAAVGSGRRSTGRKAGDKTVLPPHTATMDDCCRIVELLLGGKVTAPVPLTTGFLEITSSHELAVTAVYTASDCRSRAVSIDVEQITPTRTARG